MPELPEREIRHRKLQIQMIPSEFALGGVYFPPLLIASLLGLTLAWLSGRALNRYRLSRFFFYPPLVLLALAVIYTVIIGNFLIPL
ncbi:MAG: DUF1656 domain-containing protein [Nitrospirota bacterium]|nr:DUF1656 domain-containing protein [Nitrospirota bacterium]